MFKQHKKLIKKVISACIVLIAFLVLVVLYANWRIPAVTKDYIFDEIDKLPNIRVGLVLGTSPTMRGNIENPYFYNRIKAAQELYDAKKVKYFILSGDNAHPSYNEPKYMRQALTKAGVPDSVIFADYAGFRTFDSVVRAKEVFQQDSLIIISQKFHNERAVYLAQHYGISAYGYNAKDLSLNRASLKTKVRERFARVKVFIDIMFEKRPRFLGDPITID